MWRRISLAQSFSCDNVSYVLFFAHRKRNKCMKADVWNRVLQLQYQCSDLSLWKAPHSVQPLQTKTQHTVLYQCICTYCSFLVQMCREFFNIFTLWIVTIHECLGFVHCDIVVLQCHLARWMLGIGASCFRQTCHKMKRIYWNMPWLPSVALHATRCTAHCCTSGALDCKSCSHCVDANGTKLEFSVCPTDL